MLSTSNVRHQHKLKIDAGISAGPNADLLHRDELQGEIVALVATAGTQANSVYWSNGPALGMGTNLYQQLLQDQAHIILWKEVGDILRYASQM